MTYKGLFKPKNPSKYKGNINEIVYRSSWEKKMMIYCDTTKSVVEWGSEELVIPYVSRQGMVVIIDISLIFMLKLEIEVVNYKSIS